MLENVEWGEFRLGWEGGLFEKIKVNSLKYKTADLPNQKNKIFDLPALTAGIINQWLNNYVPRENATILKNVISISANWANTWATFYQSKEFTVLQDAYAIRYIYTNDFLTDNQYLYLTSSISNIIYWNYDWSNKAGWEKIKNEYIQLPTKNWKIDFDFMEKFIKELENQKLEKVNNYLQAMWLNNYTLTKKEENAIESLENGTILGGG